MGILQEHLSSEEIKSLAKTVAFNLSEDEIQASGQALSDVLKYVKILWAEEAQACGDG